MASAGPIVKMTYATTGKLGWNRRAIHRGRVCWSSRTSAPDNRDRRKQEEEEKKTSSTFISHLKNPIVHQLWTRRQQAKANPSLLADPSKPRSPSQSHIEISYPFSTDEFLKETYRNPWGQMRFGKILEDLDALAGNIAFAHVQDPQLNIVTASVDRIRLRRPPNLESDQHLQGKVTYVGTSSMEIRMQCINEGDEWMEAYFTFVATDPVTKRPMKIPPLTPESPLEQKYFDAGQRRAQVKKEARKRSTNKTAAAMHGGMMTDPHIEAMAQDLLAKAGPLINMPSLADPHSILMSATRLQNAEIAQPQVRNLANQIFGGFLMRRAFELAYATAYVFGGARPRFLELDEVSFQSPVDVGDLSVFHSRVLYTSVMEQGEELHFDAVKGPNVPLVTVQVEAWIAEPEKASARISNQFYFTFFLPNNTPVRTVLPSNIDEARRMAVRMAADEAQRQEDQQEYYAGNQK